jgi:hypothetical protein
VRLLQSLAKTHAVRRHPCPVHAGLAPALLPVWRHHAVFTDSPFDPGRGAAPCPRHRGASLRRRHQRPPRSYAISGVSTANAAWLSIAAMAHNLARGRRPGVPAVREVHMIGVYRTLAAADRTGNRSWPMVFLYGAVMMSAKAGLQETLYAVMALHGGAGLAVRRCRDRSCRAPRR